MYTIGYVGYVGLRRKAVYFVSLSFLAYVVARKHDWEVRRDEPFSFSALHIVWVRKCSACVYYVDNKRFRCEMQGEWCGVV